MSKERNSNIETLRIVSMLLIVLHHLCKYAYAGGASIEVDTVRNLLLLGGKVGVDAFVLITGYFLASGRIKLASLLRVLLEAWLYSLVLGLGCAFFAPDAFSAKDFLKSFLPTSGGLPWFVTAYLGLYLVAPWLARFSSGLSKAQFFSLLTVGFCVFSLVPTLTACMFVTSDFSWFCYLFLIACFIRRFGISAVFARRIFVGGGAFLIGSVVVGEIICIGYPEYSGNITYFANMYTVPTLLVSVGLFRIFEGLKMPSLRVINIIAQGTFGVYLIHENTFARKLIWQNFEFVFTGNVAMEIIYALLVAAAVFTALTCIDLARLYLLEKPLFHMFQVKFNHRFKQCDIELNAVSEKEA